MDEWQALGLSSSWLPAYLGTLVLIALTLSAARVWLRGLQPDAENGRYVGGYPLGHFILLISFAVKTALAQRLMPWWIVLVSFLSMGPWGRVLNVLRPAAPPKPEPTVQPPLAVAARPMLLVIVFVWIAAIWSGLGQWVQNGVPRPLTRSVHPATPVALAAQLNDPACNTVPAVAAWLRERSPSNPPVRVFASETQGDYLLWALPAALAPPIYTHVHLFAPEHWQAVRRVKFGEQGWADVLDHLGTNLLVVEAEIHPRLRQQLFASDTWRVLVDETGDARKPDVKSRILIAVRK